MQFVTLDVSTLVNVSAYSTTNLPKSAYLGIDKRANYPLLSGSATCRSLLTKLQTKVGLTGKLDDHSLPYRLLDPQNVSGSPDFFISFSHSKAHVAVLMAPFKNLAVDIEDQPISSAVAKRFFSLPENVWLDTLAENQQAIARELLWCLKECGIKLPQNSQTQLFEGLSQNMLDWLKPDQIISLLANRTQMLPNCLYQCEPMPHLVGYLPTCNCCVIICGNSFNNFAKKTQNFFVL